MLVTQSKTRQVRISARLRELRMVRANQTLHTANGHHQIRGIRWPTRARKKSRCHYQACDARCEMTPAAIELASGTRARRSLDGSSQDTPHAVTHTASLACERLCGRNSLVGSHWPHDTTTCKRWPSDNAPCRVVPWTACLLVPSAVDRLPSRAFPAFGMPPFGMPNGMRRPSRQRPVVWQVSGRHKHVRP